LRRVQNCAGYKIAQATELDRRTVAQLDCGPLQLESILGCPRAVVSRHVVSLVT